MAFFEAEILHQAGKALSAGQADRLGAFKNNAGARMVLQVLAHAGQIANQRDIKSAQMFCRAYAGEHEQLRRANRAAAQDNFPLNTLLRASTALLEANDSCALVFKINSKNMGVSLYSEVWPRHDRMQEGRSRAMALAIKLRNLVKAEAILRFAIEIMIAFESGFLPGGNKGFREWVDSAEIAYM